MVGVGQFPEVLKEEAEPGPSLVRWYEVGLQGLRAPIRMSILWQDVVCVRVLGAHVNPR